jgi:hypothetical protein
MELVQFYETQIADVENGFMARFIVVPRSAMNSNNLSLDYITGTLGLTVAAIMSSPGVLSPALAGVLESSDIRQAVSNFQRLMGARYRSSPEDEGSPEVDRVGPLVNFTDAVVFRRLIPFETSPLSAESLASLLAKWMGTRGGTAAGGVAALVSVVTGHPILIVLVPGGMILGGAAKGLGRALEDGLYVRILELLKGSELSKSRDA